MTFITVKYGDNQQRIFNPMCSSMILLECIRKNCQCEKGVTLDLLDENGHVKNLPENLQSYASDFLEGRGTYWLIKVEKGNEDTPNKYTLLLSQPEKHCPELQQRLEHLSKPVVRKMSRASKWTVVSKKVKPKGGSVSTKRSNNHSNTSPAPRRK
ncbi:uncharacterized protein CXorf65 homolog [Saccoglossus kowalevskii]|uniref:Uncharacterized protein CXorf65 homolog n=1 Tax=Saccoglossus kowalevskii TaxID=10224 RepID=A0ABM0GS10_SACKO|nr:PREDICTED: uncharacterized protein CXorf65 homolog [Saccoglossus kowalevskii]